MQKDAAVETADAVIPKFPISHLLVLESPPAACGRCVFPLLHLILLRPTRGLFSYQNIFALFSYLLSKAIFPWLL